MDKATILAQCDQFGEFYIKYEKLRERGVTYLQGTIDFTDKYLAKRFKDENPRPAKEDEILVFSRTNDSFRYLPTKKIRRITSLNSELDKASPFGKPKRKN